MHGVRGSPGARLALWAIRLYQRHLSPYKGFACAWRAAGGRDGCSGYGYRVIARHGLRTGLALLRRQLQRCGQAHERALAARPALAPNPRLHHQRGECDLLPCDCGRPPGVGRCLTELGCQAAGECACNKVDRWLTRWLRGWGEARKRAREQRKRS